MNHYAAWKNTLIAVLLLVCSLYALPNIFGSDFAVQISPTDNQVLDGTTRLRVERQLTQKKISYKSVDLQNNKLLVRFRDGDTQLKGQSALKQLFNRDYVIALNLAPALPSWLSTLGGQAMYLGLDLRGGVHFLLEVDMDEVVVSTLSRYYYEARKLLRDQRLYRTIKPASNEGEIAISFVSEDKREQAEELLKQHMPDLRLQESEVGDELWLTLTLSDNAILELKRNTLQQNIVTLRNRVNELGVAEPIIQQQGLNRIVVQLPGVQDTARAKEILGAVANLEFRLVDETNSVDVALSSGRIPADTQVYRFRDGRALLLKKEVIATGENITNASSGIEQNSNSPMVSISLDNVGGQAMLETTKKYLNHRMAVVFIENKVETIGFGDKAVKKKQRIEEIINAATIQGVFSNRFQITGLDSLQDARKLALLLRAGSLSAPIEIIEERTIGPNLGQDNIDAGFMSVVVGFVLVLLFMLMRYKVFGLVSNIALSFNLVMIVAILSMLQATLTLPGIAGIVLTVGMAVDANVLIFERIREELAGGDMQKAIKLGYEKALLTIADASITTLIAAIVLFSFGTGPIKGFAITLSIGILTSMFTSIVLSRAIINLIYGNKRVTKLLI